MFQIDRNNLETSIQAFFLNGHSVIDLLNHVLNDQTLLQEYLALHKVPPNSSKLPGLAVQVYLLTSKLFNFDVYGVLNGKITETITSTGKSFQLTNLDFF